MKIGVYAALTLNQACWCRVVGRDVFLGWHQSVGSRKESGSRGGAGGLVEVGKWGGTKGQACPLMVSERACGRPLLCPLFSLKQGSVPKHCVLPWILSCCCQRARHLSGIHLPRSTPLVNT